MAGSTALTVDDVAAIDAMLVATDHLLAAAYPGDSGARQPVHTVYVPADRFTPALAAEWGEQALAVAREHGGIDALCRTVGLDPNLAAEVATRVEAKLGAEPIEDLRLDFEDGYGDRGDDVEDADALAAAAHVAEAVATGVAPPFIGIRFKCFEAPTRARGLRTLDLFVGALAAAGDLPDGLVLTLPKVTTVAQVEAMVYACEKLEAAHGLPAGRLRFEVQVETPQLILAADGTVPVAQLLHMAGGRISALHYGTYDYSASLGIAAEYQSMEHPAADYAKQVMQVAVAGTGVRLSDGSTNIIPVGSPDAVVAAWQLHARLVRRSLERGYYQGWDLHAAQLPSRFIATYAFYRQGLPAAAARLKNYVHHTESGIMDEPATARALAGFIHRGLACGAVTEAEVETLAGITPALLAALAHPAPQTKK
jgi:citrate lyase beta subunit